MCGKDTGNHHDGEIQLGMHDLAAGVNLCEERPQGHAKEDTLRLKNSQLHEIEVRILSVPRAERRHLQAEAAALESEIKQLQAEFGSPFDRSIANLRVAFKNNDLPTIVECLHRLSVVMADTRQPSCEGNEDLLVELATMMQSHSTEEALAREALVVLHMLAQDPEAATALMAAGLGQQTVDALNLHVVDVDVARHGVHTLSNLFMSIQDLEDGDSVAQQLVDLNAGEAVVAAMAQHLQEQEVQLYGCLIINNLAAYKTMWSTQVTESMEIWGTTARVAAGKARRHHSSHKELIKWADAAIRIL